MRILFLLVLLLISCSSESEEELVEGEGVAERIEIPAVFGEKSFVIEEALSQFNGDTVSYPDFFELETYFDQGSHNVVSGMNWFYTRILGEPIFVYAWEVEPEWYQIFMFKNGENTLLYQNEFSYWTDTSLYLSADLSGSGDQRVGFIDPNRYGEGSSPSISLQDPDIWTDPQYETTYGVSGNCKTQIDFEIAGTAHVMNFQRFPCDEPELPLLTLDGLEFEHPFFNAGLPADYSIEDVFFSPDLKVLLFNFQDHIEYKHYVMTWNMETGEKEVYELFSHSALDITYGFERSDWLYDGQNFELQLTNDPEDTYEYTLYPYDQVPSDSNETILFEGEKIRQIQVSGDMWDCSYRFETLAGEELPLSSRFDKACLWMHLGWSELSLDEEYLYFTAWEEDMIDLYSYHFDSQKEEKLLSLYASSDGINFFTWSPSGNRLAFEVVNQSAEDYPTRVKAFVLDLSEGKLLKKQKFDIEAFYSCGAGRCSGEGQDFLFLDENTLQYRGHTDDWFVGELKTIQIP